MRFEIQGHVDVERQEGRFVAADEIQSILQDLLDDYVASIGADLQGIGVDGTSLYDVMDSGVEVTFVPSPKRKLKRVKPASC